MDGLFLIIRAVSGENLACFPLLDNSTASCCGVAPANEPVLIVGERR